MLLPDPNPILDEGAPTSTGGIENAITLCDVLGIPFEIDPPRERYYHGWGDQCLGARITICSWTITIHDIHGKPTSFTFDLVSGSSPLILGQEVREYCNTFNLTNQRYIQMRRPHDDAYRYLYTYLVPSDGRLRLDLAPHPLSTKRTLLGNIHTSAKREPLAFSKRVHRYTHATAEEMKLLCKEADMLDKKLEEAIEQVCNACDVCAKNGRPVSSKKVSLTHVNQAFNEELQIDFMFPTIRGSKQTVMHMTDTGTGFSETTISNSRTARSMQEAIETLWICQHGAPRAVSADDEFNCVALQQFLRAHNIEFKPRPTRRHNKTGIVERKNATIKAILGKLDDELSDATANTLLKRATFFSNMFSGSHILSSFELVRGYRPSVVGLPCNSVTQELLDAHKEQVATRKLQRLLKSRNHHCHQPDLFIAGDRVWVFYKTSKQNEAVEWIAATVVAAHPHYLEVRRTAHGRPMRVAYEDVRFKPQGLLATELLSCSLEEELTKPMESIQSSGNDNSPDVGDNPDATPVPDSPPPQTLHLQNSLLAVTADSANQQPTLTNRPDGGQRDIGTYAATIRNGTEQGVSGRTLERDISRELDIIYDAVGSKQVTATQLSFSPPFILQDALKREHDLNWVGAYDEIADQQVPRYANVITSHVVYKLKTDENGNRKLKARIVPHGNHDDEKDNVRKDSSNAPLFVVRLLLSLATFLGFRIGTADIKGAFLQSGPITRQIFVRPPREWTSSRATLWKLRKLPYGIADAGRQWQKTVETWMLEHAGVERVFGLSQLFVKRDTKGKVILLIAKVTDDFLLGGSTENMRQFTAMLAKRFEVGKVIIDDKIHFDGSEIEQAKEGDITMSMKRYVERLKPIDMSRSRRKMREDTATENEIQQYRSLAATMMYLGNAVLPQASYATSLLQQKLPKIRVEDLITANEVLKDILSLKPQIIFRSPPSSTSITEVIVSSFSDAAFNHSDMSGYGQTGLLTGLRIKQRDGVDLYHAIDWSSSKQKRVSYSPYGAEVLACAEADDRGYYIKIGLMSLFPNTKVRNELSTDSRCLYDTITTLHEGRDYRLRPTVQRIRNSFDSHELNHMRWIAGNENPSDALTKRNIKTWRLLNEILANGVLCTNVESGYAVDSELWQ